jgi:uncharacterized protein with PQ loop repeat
MILEHLLGWVGSICFAVCAIPQTYMVYKQGNAKGVSAYFLWLWIVGEITTILYVLGWLFSIPLLINYTINLICLGFITKYKYFPVNRE